MIPTTNAVVGVPFSVVVIGGGFAGLSAVQTLVRESQQQQDQSMPSSSLRPMHITLLEAKDRLGGRMHTVSLNPSTATTASKTSDDDELHSSSAPVVADMGGMYFHGQGSVLKNLQEAFPQWKTTGSGGDSAVPAGHDAIFKVYQRNNNNDNIDNQNNENTNNELRTARDLTAREKQEISDLYTEWMNDMQNRFHEFQNNSNNNDNDSVVDESSHPALLSKWSQEFCNRVLQRQGDDDDDDDDDPDNSAKKQDKERNKQEEEEEERLLLLLQGLEFYQRMHFDLDFAIAWPQVAMDGWTNDWGCNDLPGDDVISVDGMRALIHAMEMQLNEMTTNNNKNTPTTLTIRKQTRVERIEYDLDCSQSLLSKSCRIVTSDQAVFEADACICTIPLGVLKKRAMELFVPPLPSDTLQALERAGVGTLNTLVVQWNKPIHGYCCEKTTEEESKKDKSNHDATTSSALLSGYYLIGPADDNKDDNNNNNAVDKNANPLWHGFVFPEVLRNQQDASITQFHFYETENLPFDNLDFWKLQALQVVQAAVVGGTDNKPVVCLEDIVNVQLSAWHLDPDCLGSYSAPTTMTRGNVDRKILAEPIVVRASYDGAGTRTGLYFAGEHTHYEGRFATMDGAYETGIRAARQVLQQKADGAGR
jgi:monoamine oxidase